MKNLFFTVIGISLFCLVLYFTSDQDKKWSYGVEIDQLTDQKTFYSNLTKKTDDNENVLQNDRKKKEESQRDRHHSRGGGGMKWARNISNN